MKGFKKYFGAIFQKNSSIIICGLMLSVTLMSNRLYGQTPPSAQVNILGSKVICETSPAIIDFSGNGASPFKFVYTITDNSGNVKNDSISTSPGNTDTSITHPVGMVGTFTYMLINVSDANFSHVSQISSQILTVQPLPTATAGDTGAVICADGGTVTATGVATNGTINWNRGNGNGFITNPTSPTPTYTANLTDAGKIIALIMTVTSNNLCSSQPAATDRYYVPVRQAMLANFSISSPLTCLNSPDAKVTFVATNGTPPYTFTYSVNSDNSIITTVGTNSIAVLGGITSITGSYTYNLISVQDANCLQSVVGVNSQSVIVNPLPQATLIGNPQACQNDTPFPTILIEGTGGTKPYTVLLAINGKDTAISLNITPGGLVDSLKYPQSTSVPGIFTYSLISVHDNAFGTDGLGNYQGCYGTITNSSAIATIEERPYARFSVTPQRVSSLDATVTINDASIAATNWFWDFGDSTVSPFAVPGTHTYKDTGTYTIKLKVSTGVACSDITSQNVRVYLPFTLFIPTAFSPNNDGVNDVFTPKGDGITLSEYNMTIYDRWGNKIFYSNDINKGWDGTVNGGSTIVPIDTYAYVINLVADEDGKTYIYYGSVSSTLR
jgi:gliding motility-associated-like protein